MPEWAEIPGFPGYPASDDGEIMNPRGRILSQRPASNGGRQVDIGNATVMVGNAVLRAHTGRPLDPGYYVRYLNGDRADNRLENLVWTDREPRIVYEVDWDDALRRLRATLDGLG